MQFTIMDFDRVYREQGINLLSDDLKIDYMESINQLNKFRKTKYEPFINVISKKDILTKEQELRKQILDQELIDLMSRANFHKVIYFSKVRELLLGDTLENVDVSRETIDEFIDIYEKTLKQYFFENRKEKTQDVEEVDEPKKFEDLSGTSPMRLKKWVCKLIRLKK